MIDIKEEISDYLNDSDNEMETSVEKNSTDETSLQKLNSRMKKEVVKFSYKRKNGSVRKARGTLQKKKMPHVKPNPGAKKPDSVFVYWDVDKNNYRSFRRNNFLRTLSESSNALTFVYDIDIDHVTEILNTSEITNKRYNRQQFEKYLENSIDLIFCGIFEQAKCRAMVVLSLDMPKGTAYIAEYQAFVQGGYAAQLLMDTIRKYKSVWLMADPTASDSLLDYYRSKRFGFSEYVLPNSIWGPAHFFYTKDCDEDSLRRHIDEQYTEN